MNIKAVKIADLKPNPKNPRAISEDALAGLNVSIEKFGLVEPIVVNETSGHIVGGHQRLEVLKKQGVTQTYVVVVQLPDKEEMELNVALNNKEIQGDWTEDIVEILESFKIDFPEDFEALKFDALLDDIDFNVSEKEEEEEDSVPDVVVGSTFTCRGDLWELGRHKLFCGDSTMIGDVEKLMGGENVDCLMTDPPYGVDYSGKNEFLNKMDHGTRIQTLISNDAITNYREWFASFLSIIPFADYNTFYIWMSGQELHNLRLAIGDCGYKWSDYLIWVKHHLVLGRKDYNAKHGFCVYGWKKHHKFYGESNSVTTLEYDKSHVSDLHPTMKPVDMIEKLIKDGSFKGSIVMDCFGGSGSTLIACEQTGRKARLMEIDEHYCDVIIQRYVNLVGNKNIKLNGIKYKWIKRQ